MDITESPIYKKVIRIIESTTKVNPKVINPENTFSQLGFDLRDVTNVILKVEKTFRLNLPEDAPLNALSHLVSFVQLHRPAEKG